MDDWVDIDTLERIAKAYLSRYAGADTVTIPLDLETVIVWRIYKPLEAEAG